MRSLHVRMAMLVAVCALAMGAALLALARHYAAEVALESGQRMNLGLARYIVEHQPRPLLDLQGRPDSALMRDLALHVMMINPSVEVYLLDSGGRVLAHALEEERPGDEPIGRRVDVERVRALWNAGSAPPPLPLLGDDPRRPGESNIVSVERFGTGASTGFVYVVLRGRTAQDVTGALWASAAWREIAGALLLVTAIAILVSVVVARRWTRPLRQLVAVLGAFRGAGGPAGPTARGDEIAQLNATTTVMRERIEQQFAGLQEADRIRRELVGTISHDLRTPLSNLQGYVESVLLRGDEWDAATRKRHLLTALRHGRLLDKRIAELFELSKLDAGREIPHPEVFDLAELLQDVSQSYQLAAQRRRVRLSLATDSHVKARVQADIAMIERVLQNLIDNALRHTPAGGHVTLALASRGASFEVSVTDSGRGMGAEELTRLIEGRVRPPLPPAAVHDGAGSGLGLVIVRRILELHGATLEARSAIAQGSSFRFALPQLA